MTSWLQTTFIRSEVDPDHVSENQVKDAALALREARGKYINLVTRMEQSRESENEQFDKDLSWGEDALVEVGKLRPKVPGVQAQSTEVGGQQATRSHLASEFGGQAQPPSALQLEM